MQDHERQARVIGAKLKRPLGFTYHAMGDGALGQLEAQYWHAIGGAECALIQSACFLVTE